MASTKLQLFAVSQCPMSNVQQGLNNSTLFMLEPPAQSQDRNSILLNSGLNLA